MSINADKLVKVLPRVITAGSSTLELNGLMISTNSFIPTEKFLSFYSSDEVGAFFGTTSKEYELSVNYFLGFNNSTKKPTTLLFARDITSALKGCLFGGKVNTTLEVLKTITNGDFNITIKDINVELSGIDLSGATSLSDIASTLQTAIRTGQTDPALTSATMSYSSINKNFIIETGSAGEEATISYATGDIAEVLNLTQQTAIFVSNGKNATPIASMMNSFKTISLNWVSFMTITEMTKENKIDYATWVNSQNSGCRFVYVCQDSDANAKVNGNETNTGYLINYLELSGTTLQYNTANLSAFVMGAIASINYEVENGRITFAFKSQDGLSYTCNEDNDAENLTKNGYNFYGDYATNNDKFKLYQSSKVSGQYQWLDSLVNAIWLNDRLQTNILDLMANSNSLPYNQVSYDKIINACSDTLQLAVNNGVITKGITLSATQKIQLMNEAGVDISDTMYSEGYFMQVKDPSATARQSREEPIANLWYCDGGSIQKMVLNSTMVL